MVAHLRSTAIGSTGKPHSIATPMNFGRCLLTWPRTWACRHERHRLPTIREAFACLVPSSGSVDASPTRNPASWQLSAPHLHICGTCYERHNANTARGCTLSPKMARCSASHTDVPKEQNALPISRSGHSTSSVPWPSQFIEITRSIFLHGAQSGAAAALG